MQETFILHDCIQTFILHEEKGKHRCLYKPIKYVGLIILKVGNFIVIVNAIGFKREMLFFSDMKLVFIPTQPIK